MSKIKFKTQASIALAISITFSSSSFLRPVHANPAILAPAAICAGTAGIGCVLIGVAVVGGVTYYVWRASNGRHYAADAFGNISQSERLVGTKKPSPLQSRGISGIEAAKRGNAHWVASNDPTLCYKMAKKYGWRVKEHPPAAGGGRWCIFHGKQTSFGGGNN